ncbi:hypothetical protein MBSD_n2575 [Mizugakiibacter sediminis]|uniref:Uncharacterized protein n=1 Tax=Mizugakiibacter sediminis TaxID=1475481 RepID=A0A0K8QS83_9GAMM|nr:hypothetical protein [Mizugakiibacter sediminis]GAP67257.1 hypothetical protein MBSD_n2575 [Mizugakiibacter sediminis]
MAKRKAPKPTPEQERETAIQSLRELLRPGAPLPPGTPVERSRHKMTPQEHELAEVIDGIKSGRLKVFNPHKDPLPAWKIQGNGWGSQNPPSAGYVCDDPGEQTFAVMVMIRTGWSLPDFDLWLDSIGQCGARVELMIRREWLRTAMQENDENAIYRHLEWMQNRRRGIEREQALLPMAQTGAKVRKPFDDANKKRKRQAGDNVGAWKARAAKLWAMPRHRGKSASDIARLIDPARWNTIRRHLRRPSK